MLLPEEFSVGCIGEVTTGLALVLPRGRYEHMILITCASGSPYAIFLDGEHEFNGFECSNNDVWKGLLIPNVRIEVDEGSVFVAEGMYPPLGALVRKNTQIEIVTLADGGFREKNRTPLIVDLPPCHQNIAAGFAKWRIVLGEGIAKRELMHINIGEKPAA
jgi:hypothetical protein